MYQNNTSLRKCFIYINFKNLICCQIIFCKFFRQKSNSHVISHCREDHVCSRQLYIR